MNHYSWLLFIKNYTFKDMMEFNVKRLNEFCSYAIKKLLETMVQYDEENEEVFSNCIYFTYFTIFAKLIFQL